MYENCSGRSGDPDSRLGEALAQSSARKSANAAKDKSITQRVAEGHVRRRTGLFGLFYGISSFRQMIVVFIILGAIIYLSKYFV